MSGRRINKKMPLDVRSWGCPCGYLDALARSGGPRLGADKAWDGYRAHQLHGITWATLKTRSR